jgi:hypothetical protein
VVVVVMVLLVAQAELVAVDHKVFLGQRIQGVVVVPGALVLPVVPVLLSCAILIVTQPPGLPQVHQI